MQIRSRKLASNTIKRTTLLTHHLLNLFRGSPLSTSTMSSSTPTPKAPWRDLFTIHLSQNTSSEFSLSTTTHDASKNRPVPRVRLCGFRGFFPSPQLHSSAVDTLEKQGEGLNPDVYESDMPSFTTDVRMEKVAQIQPSEGEGERGNEVEMVFWLKDVASQWRIKGVAFVIGNPERESTGEKTARGEIQKGLRVCSDDSREGWTWERQVTTYFANHSPVMRGSFRNPPPGQPRSQVPQNPALKIGQKVDDLHDPASRKNFRVVVVRPEQVERLDLTDYENARRWTWTLVEDGKQPGHWEEVELWP